MPTYDYKCDACGHTFEEWQSFKDEPLTKCPACKKKKLRRLFGGGAAVIFKGSGFYETDYRKESYKKAEKAEQDAAKPAGEKADAAKPAGGKADANGSTAAKAGDGGGDKKGGSSKAKKTES
jgi:putative FmdB family regulatory protein